MPKEAKRCDAVVLQHDAGFVVDPACARVSGHELVFTIRNLTDFSDALVQLPATRVEHGSHREKILKPGQSESFKLWRQNGTFAYRVTVEGQRAHGNSDPVIIIDPPCS